MRKDIQMLISGIEQGLANATETALYSEQGLDAYSRGYAAANKVLAEWLKQILENEYKNAEETDDNGN